MLRGFSRLLRDPLLKRFNIFLVNQELGGKRRIKYLYMLRKLMRYHDLDHEDPEEIMAWIRENYKSFTRRDYLLTLKYYYKFRGEDEKARGIRANVKKSEVRKLIPQQLLTEEEVYQMMNSTKNIMYKALIMLLWESGLRAGEILSLKKENIEATEYGFRLYVNGKTGVRTVPIVESASYLSKWLEQCKIERVFPITYDALRMYVKKLAKKAGIKKRVYLHLFRHSRATVLARNISESVMKKYFGWTDDSRMPSIYVHLSAYDVESSMLNYYGVKNQRREEKIICRKCGHPNPLGAKYCLRCGSPLNTDEIIEYEYKLQSLMKKIDKLEEYKEKLEKIIK